MANYPSTFRGAAASSVQFDIPHSAHKGHTFTSTANGGQGKLRLYYSPGKEAGRHFGSVEDASAIYGSPAAVVQFGQGETYFVPLANEQFGLSAQGIIDHLKTGYDIPEVVRMSDAHIQQYHHTRNQRAAHQQPSQQAIEMDRLDVDYRKTGHMFVKTSTDGYGKIRLYGERGKQPGQSFASVSNASHIYSAPRFVVQFQSGEFYRIAVEDPSADVASFIEQLTDGPDLRAKRMSSRDVTEYLLAKNFHDIHGRPANVVELQTLLAQHQAPSEGAEARR